MRSWRKSVWFKRILAAVVLVATLLLYGVVTGKLEENQADLEENIAQATAAVWVNSAIFRENSEKYLAVRDSLLIERGISVETIRKFFDKYENSPEQYLGFSKRVSKIVDSLVFIEDSISRMRRELEADSADTSLIDSSGTF